MRRSRVATRAQTDSGLLLAFTFLIGLLILAMPARASCLDHIVDAEKEYGIPKGMLLAVSLVESGGGGTPNPFIMNVRGRVLFPRSEAEAATYLRDNKGNLRGNVYAGCMQLSLADHKQAFRPVEKIVNPEANVRYAAKFLVSLRRETGSWAAAVTKYNGSSGVKAAAYQCKVKNQLVSLGAQGSADLISTVSACDTSNPPSVGSRTRRAFARHDENIPVS